jgi:hypothetical protein
LLSSNMNQIVFSSLLFSATMSLLDQRGDVRDWAPPGWRWEVLPSGTRSLVRNPGDVVDPDLVWWRSRGPRSVQREPVPEEVVRQRIREEDEHVRRYVYLLDREYSNSWSILRRDPYHVSYNPVRVPYLWMRSARDSAPRGLGPGRS